MKHPPYANPAPILDSAFDMDSMLRTCLRIPQETKRSMDAESRQVEQERICDELSALERNPEIYENQ